MAAVATDLRFAVRVIRRRPSYYVLASLILAIGIGATTAVFNLGEGCCGGACQSGRRTRRAQGNDWPKQGCRGRNPHEYVERRRYLTA
jgi:hypothetical protein